MKRFILVSSIIIVVAGFLALWWNYSTLPLDSNNRNVQTFVITKGDGVREIAKKLHDQGLIRDQVAFFLLVKKLGIEKNIQAGSYRLSASDTAEKIAKRLTVGTEDLWITIPEGWRNEEVDDYLSKAGFHRTASDPKMGEPQGKLFPDTYLVPKESTIESIELLMAQNFTKKVTFPVSNDELIIASMVEREAKKEIDRPLIASVIFNRLKIGMALNIDATVQYAIGFTAADGWWKKELTTGDLKFKSPYNTYLNAGLPPGPICNPGLSSIKSALNPAQTDYLYYIADKQGTVHYARTLEEHNQNIARYLDNQ